MLPLPPFVLHRPDRLDQAVALAAAPGARILAGGTDLLPSMKHRLFTPKVLVSLQACPGLDALVETDQGLRVGAMVRLAQLAAHPIVAQRLPILAAACRTVATRTIQHTATLGGNLMLDTRCLYYNQPEGWRCSVGGCLKKDGTVCHVAPRGTGCYAVHSADTVPVLCLLGAQAELQGPMGVRMVPIGALYDPADGRTWLRTQPGEILTQVHIPWPAADAAMGWYKVRSRAAIDYGAVLVAVSRQGTHARAVLSAVGPAPLLIEGEAASLAERARHLARPTPTHIHDTAWRRHMVGIAVQRALAQT